MRRPVSNPLPCRCVIGRAFLRLGFGLSRLCFHSEAYDLVRLDIINRIRRPRRFVIVFKTYRCYPDICRARVSIHQPQFSVQIGVAGRSRGEQFSFCGIIESE